jgi:UDP-N-acetyl-D-mannosaminuronate dehydrogenase
VSSNTLERTLTFANTVSTTFAIGDIIQNRDAKVGSGVSANGIIQEIISSVPDDDPLDSRVVVRFKYATLSAEFEDNDVIVIETPHKNYNQIKLNKVSSATSANLTSVWTLADVSGANAYYYTGTVS